MATHSSTNSTPNPSVQSPPVTPSVQSPHTPSVQPTHPHSFTKLQLALFTWNTGNSIPLYAHIADIRSRILKEGIDVLVFGLQENFIKAGTPWSLVEDPILRMLQESFMGEDLVQVHYCYLLGIAQVIFVRSSLVPFFKELAADTVRTGFSGWVGNKGAVCVLFQLGSVTICCACCHLCSVETNVQRRNEEIAEILQAFPWFDRSNYAFLYGDLNYRLDVVTFHEALELLRGSDLKKLLQFDQLQRQILTERISRFDEAAICFRPSYKLVPRSPDNYNNAKLRTPAWCDRIVYRTSDRPTPAFPHGPRIPARLEPVEYGCLEMPDTSDHKMVFGYFDLFSDWLEYSPPLEFILSDVSCPVTRDLTGRILVLQNLSDRVSTIAKPPRFSTWDWIAMHRFGCLSTQDYCCYVYSPLRPGSGSPGTEKSYSFTFRARNFPKNPGASLYQLYYHTVDKDVLAVSHPFSLTRTEESSPSVLMRTLNSD